MEYLTTIENTEYFHWQIELLIESFKIQGIENQLLVGIIDTTNKPFPKNLKNHSRVFSVPNYPYKYSPINQPFLAKYALEKNLISQPFTLMHSDTMLVKPSEETDKNISFSISEQFPLFLKADNPEAKNIRHILPLGGIYKFNNIPLTLFDFVINTIKQITNFWDKSPNYWRYANRLAWMSAFVDYAIKNPIKGELLESQLFAPLLPQTEFVHYCHGLATLFHKNMFKGTIILSDSDPVSIFANPYHNHTTTTNHCMKVAQSYQNL